MLTEEEKKLFANKIKCLPAKSYKEAVDLLSYALNKKTHTYDFPSKISFYEPSQSHIFITIEISQMIYEENNEIQNYKSVLTLIDLAGFTNENNSPEKVGPKLHEKENDFLINKSLDSLRQYLLNVDLHKYKQYSFSSDSNSILTQLIKQNFMNDSRITILGTIPYFSDKTATHEELLKTLSFVNKFKNIVGRLLFLSSEERESIYENDNSLDNISVASRVENLPPKITKLGKSFCTNASTERYLNFKPQILAINKALRGVLQRCLDCHNVSSIISSFVINKTLEQLCQNLDEKIIDINASDVDIYKLQQEVDQSLDQFLIQMEGKIGNPDDCKTRSEIEKLAQSISKLLFYSIAKMCCIKKQTPSQPNKSPENNKNILQIAKILQNNEEIKKNANIIPENPIIILEKSNKQDQNSENITNSTKKLKRSKSDQFTPEIKKPGSCKNDSRANDMGEIKEYASQIKNTDLYDTLKTKGNTQGSTILITGNNEKSIINSTINFAGKSYMQNSQKIISDAFSILKHYFDVKNKYKNSNSACLPCHRSKVFFCVKSNRILQKIAKICQFLSQFAL